MAWTACLCVTEPHAQRRCQIADFQRLILQSGFDRAVEDLWPLKPVPQHLRQP